MRGTDARIELVEDGRKGIDEGFPLTVDIVAFPHQLLLP